MAVKYHEEVYVTAASIPISMVVQEKDESSSSYTQHGISVWATGLLLTGELAGAGMVALPQAVQYMGPIIGVIALLVCALLCGYVGILLGECWSMLQERYPEYREHCKRPYQEISRIAVGNWMTHVVSVTIDLTLFGTCVSYLVLAASSIHSLLVAWFSINISFCLFLVILAICLLPLTFLGSPKDFWQVVVLAMICTTIAFVIIIVGMTQDYHNLHSTSQNTVSGTTEQPATELFLTTESAKPDDSNDPMRQFDLFFLAFGVVIFAYTGHSAFPTIQQDMKQPEKWKWSIVMAFVLQLFYYIPISLIGYYVYGDAVKDSIMANLGVEWASTTSKLLITFHVLFSFILMINPVSHEMEHIFNVPHKFCLKRVLVRSALVVLVLFVAESIPNFGVLLSLIGGSGSALLALVFPPLFYYLLRRKFAKEESEKVGYFSVATKIRPAEALPEKPRPSTGLPWYTVVIIFVIIAIGVFTTLGSTYSSLKTMIHPGPNDAFKSPCYVNPSVNMS